jgi:hypothetical protein
MASSAFQIAGHSGDGCAVDNVAEDWLATKAPLEATFRRSDKHICTPLTLNALTFSSGIPNQYEVVGLPCGQKAFIALRRRRTAEIWKLKRSGSSLYKGSFSSEEAALAALQAELQPSAKGKALVGAVFEEEPEEKDFDRTVRDWRLL